MQESNALQSFSLAAARRRTLRLLPVNLFPLGLIGAIDTTRTVASARAFRSWRNLTCA